MHTILAERVPASGEGDNRAVDTQAGDGPDARAQGCECVYQDAPAPPPRCEEDMASAAGAAEGAPVIVIDTIGGWCPVQAEGTIDGLPFYFRARGTHWELYIADKPDGDALDQPHRFMWSHYGDWPSAGYMTEDEARGFIRDGAIALMGNR